MLKLAPSLSLPDDVLTEALAIVANRGAGKTYTSKKLIELMTEVGLPTCVIDPLGVWWGLRSSADGTKPGLPFIVFGGEHGDAPLKPQANQEAAYGRIIAQWLLENPVPVILDMSDMRKAAQRRFVAGFMDELYEGNRNPLHVVVDECDLFCPQRPPKDFPMSLLGTMEDVVRRGRSKGLGITLISQRPAVIHKDVLSQISVLICLRLVGPQDRNAIKDWIDTQGTPEERKTVMDSLPNLDVGEGWLYSPAFLGILQKFKAHRAKTFDSSATPKVGETRIEPTAFASVDLDVLSERIQATVEEAKANDPSILKMRVRDLERQVADLTQQAALTKIEYVEVVREVEVISEAQMTLLRGSTQMIGKIIEDLTDVAAVTTAVLDTAQEDQGAGAIEAKMDAIAKVGASFPPPTPLPPAPPIKIRSVSTGRGEGDGSLSKAERQVMSVLAQFPEGRTYNQIAILSGRSGKSSAFKNALSSLRTSGALAGDNKGIMVATPEGLERLGEWDPLPQGRALFDHWASALGRSERTVLQVLVDYYPLALTKADISTKSGYSETSSGFKNALSKLRTLELAHGYDEMVASEIFFTHGDWR